MPSIKLNTGHSMPVIGLGTWQARGDPVVQAVKDALEIGFRHIDTALLYQNEKEVGEGVRAEIAKGTVKREDVFITTKVWPEKGITKQKSLDTVQHSLKQMNLSYIDLVLVHWPHEDWKAIYAGLEEAFDQKLVRSIGVSNFSPQNIEELMKTAKVKPAVNQINIHPTLNQDETVEYCKKHDIAVTGYSPLGVGHILDNPTLMEIGKKHKKSSAQVAIRWQIQRGLIVIPKSTHKAYIKEDFEVFDFVLTDEEMKRIHDLK